MDGLTQIALGAAVGEVVLGKKVGNKALLWGGVAGYLPDLDAIVTPFVSDVHGMVLHRSITHSFFFAIVFAPVLGALFRRLNRAGPASWRDWSWLAFGALVTHPMLDSFTTYGTQLFQPFSHYPVAFNTIFIIDPLYSVPLIAGVIATGFLRRHPAKRRLATYLGLGLSSFYLLLTVVNKYYVTSVFDEALRAQGLTYERISTRPGPFTNLLWTALAEDGDGFWVGLYSLLDDGRTISFQRVEKNAAAFESLQAHPDLTRLGWFSRGYYRVKEDAGDLVFSDLRFGRSDLWLGDTGAYLFGFRIRRDPADPTRVQAVERERGWPDLNRQWWGMLWARTLGRM